jgi:rRNA maturation protein Nop10
MATLDVKISCQRCGTPMTMADPRPDDPWRPDQYWICPKCGRHFWSTYPAPAEPAATTQPVAAAPKPDTTPKT